MQHASVVPVRLREHSPELTVDVSRIVGYRARQGDEWKGPVRGSYRDASRDASERNAELRTQAMRTAGGSQQPL